MVINIWTCQWSFAYTWGIQKNAQFNCSKFFQKGCKKSKFFTHVFLNKNQNGHFWRSYSELFSFFPLWGRVQRWDCIFSPSSTAPADSLWELSCFLSIKADPLIAPITARQALKVQSVSYETWYYTSNSDKYVLQSLLHCFQRKYKNYPFLSDASKPSS